MSGFEYLGISQDTKMNSLAAFRNPYELNISSSTTLGNGTMTDEQLRQYAPDFLLGPDGKLLPGAREAVLSMLKKKPSRTAPSRTTPPRTTPPANGTMTDEQLRQYAPEFLLGPDGKILPGAREARPAAPSATTTVSPSVPTTKSGMSTKHVVGYGIGALVVGYALFMGYKALQDRR